MIKNIISAIALGIFVFIAFGSGEKEGGVRANNNMEKYALEYIENNNILNGREEIIAYYDYTISLSSKECVILTNERIIYHNIHTYTKHILLENIKNINHREHIIDGDVIHIQGTGNGEFMTIKIAYLNDGKYFYEMLKIAEEEASIKKYYRESSKPAPGDA